MEKLLLIVCAVFLPTLMQGLPTKQKGTEILMKDSIDAPIQEYGNKNTKRNIYTVVSEENTEGDDGAKDIFIIGIQSFFKAKRLIHTGSGIVKRSYDNMEDLHARGVSTTTTIPVTPPPIAQTPPTITNATAAITAATTTTPIPTINLPKIDFCKILPFSCKRTRKGWLFG